MEMILHHRTIAPGEHLPEESAGAEIAFTSDAAHFTILPNVYATAARIEAPISRRCRATAASDRPYLRGPIRHFPKFISRDRTLDRFG